MKLTGKETIIWINKFQYEIKIYTTHSAYDSIQIHVWFLNEDECLSSEGISWINNNYETIRLYAYWSCPKRSTRK